MSGGGDGVDVHNYVNKRKKMKLCVHLNSHLYEYIYILYSFVTHVVSVSTSIL